MNEQKKNKSALSVSKGVDQPSAVNPDSVKTFRNRRKEKKTVSRYIDGIKAGNITVLSQAITLIESSLPEHQVIAAELIEKCIPVSGNSMRIGITGVPGVGKSSFIESFGKMLTGKGARLAVLTIDPSSELSKGSILGDKTRMAELSADPSAYIRPSPSRGALGGVAARTRESMILCEAAGYDVIIVETVGVGQSEIAVHSMVDFFMLLMLSGAGDELQGIKRGIMEMADLIVITKSDGDNIARADLAKSQYNRALKLFPPPSSGWVPRVQTCSSMTNMGLHDIYDTLQEYFDYTGNSEYLIRNRKEQALYWLNENIDQQLKDYFFKHDAVRSELETIKQEVVRGEVSSYQAARRLIERYLNITGEKPGSI